MKIMRHHQYPRFAWKNGLGETAQIALHLPVKHTERDNFDWRISLAPVEQGGPFSNFPEHDRVLVIWQGAGVRMTVGERKEEVKALVPFAFSGAEKTTCELIDGPIHDLNVFTHRGVCHATVRVQASPVEVEAKARWNFAFCAHASFKLGGEAVHAGDCVEYSEPLRLQSEPQCQVVLIGINPL